MGWIWTQDRKEEKPATQKKKKRPIEQLLENHLGFATRFLVRDRKNGDYERGLSLEESLEALKSLNSLESWVLICLPLFGGSLESLLLSRICKLSRVSR